jgi:hypothetical protein
MVRCAGYACTDQIQYSGFQGACQNTFMTSKVTILCMSDTNFIILGDYLMFVADLKPK